MLATLVIGLREGLEAALIVGIIAAFLRREGRSLTAMWWGVGLAVLLSLAVGLSLAAVEHALPQAAQEGMESIIGAVAIFFVTGMIVWMNAHARGMRKELEAEAAQALGRGSANALAVMAFLAVLKEGFETSVFLLATFSAAQSASLAAVGAVLGVLVAIGIGWGIYVGGVRLNLSRFFRITGAFLVLVAAGLVVTTLRTAHEAGWLNAGQQRTVDLAWLVQPGSLWSALITGVLGIPSDPRLVEVVGWVAYLVPVALFVYWPVKHRPRGRAQQRLRIGAAAALAVAAGVLVLAVPTPSVTTGTAPLTTAKGTGTARLAASGTVVDVAVSGAREQIRLTSAGRADDHAGVAARLWRTQRTSTPADATPTVTLDRLVQLSGGRLPVGLNAAQNPGPFQASWRTYRTTSVWLADGVLLDGSSRTTTLVTLSGGGLTSTRTLTLSGSSWQVAPRHVTATAEDVRQLGSRRTEHRFWGVVLPIALLVAAALVLLVALRRRPVPPAPQSSTAPAPRRSNTHAVP
ncbi:iron permease [Nocardioides mangrovicus]|uniref:Iron permease n=1 Tax=Nocardioides mangrovicus TaxID=2478913 RepID=A0A3L8NXR5_9ACTN|nr:iron uptake transporter permease EfeU [Nocardioides mangrovicus]RLV47482.1 iron permease [Nocardioides mangrovicus]